MAEEVLEQTLQTYLRLPFFDKGVALQGGEPLIAPQWVLERTAALAGGRAALSLQTNGSLITERLAAFLAETNWLVGISLDGPKALNDAVRGDGAYAAAVRGIRLLERTGADYNLLCVVSKANVAHPLEVYRHLRDSFSTRHHQYIECTGPLEELAVSGEEWGNFLCALFDEWAQNDTETISVRLFDSIFSLLVRGVPTLCSQSQTCRHHLVVDCDGSVYPCDFYVRGDLRLGSVMTHSWEEMLSSPVYERFAGAKRAALPQKCLGCEFLQFCAGDCPRNARRLCDGWRRFFSHLLDSAKFAEIAASRILGQAHAPK